MSRYSLTITSIVAAGLLFVSRTQAQSTTSDAEIAQAVAAMQANAPLRPHNVASDEHQAQTAERRWAEALLRLNNLIERAEADDVLSAAQTRLGAALDIVEKYLQVEVEHVPSETSAVPPESQPSQADIRLSSEGACSPPSTHPADSRLSEVELSQLLVEAQELRDALDSWINVIHGSHCRDTATNDGGLRP